MPKGQRANSVVFGFDFQVNAAIVLMLENIKNLTSLRLEGNNEDIELQLDNGNTILAQAKSVVAASSDFRNVRANLKKSLETLSLAEKNVSVEKIIFVTNSINPLNEKNYSSVFIGETRKPFYNLPKSSQNIICGFLKKIKDPLNLDKFQIHVIPFETDIEEERYKIILNHIDKFIVSLNCGSLRGCGDDLLYIWFDDVFVNSTKKNAKIVLDKKKIIWPLIVKVTDGYQYEREMAENFELDEGLFEEVRAKYGELIKNSCERYDFITSVLYDFQSFSSQEPITKKCLSFAKQRWKDFVGELNLTNENPEIQEKVVQIILYYIVKNRYSIDKIKQGVNL